ncbi:hypothetical protein XENOCAPTIV_014348 [Xenoophorus captivus]|uniref:Uncharacterized protein n=1 Tax=Xenoophorus captivus TaxID=1517983 RepID=A0ABV0R2G3_9TELE
MTKPKSNKKDKGSEDDILDDQTKLACAEVASASTSNPSSTNEDVLAAINNLSGTVDMRLVELNSSISSLRAALSDICDRVSSIQGTAELHDRWISELKKRCDSLAAQCSQQQAKLEDIEARSRRQNIRIVGIPEKAENAFGKQWDPDPLIAIFGAPKVLPSANKYEKVALLFGMVIAKRLILKVWKKDFVPTFDLWLGELANTDLIDLNYQKEKSFPVGVGSDRGRRNEEEEGEMRRVEPIRAHSRTLIMQLQLFQLTCKLPIWTRRDP